MNNTHKLIIGAVVVIVLVWVGVSVLSNPTTQEPASGEVKGDTESTVTEPIKMGFIAPLSGDAASYGESEQHAVELALAEINSQGGVLGRPLTVIYEDGKCNGKDATTAAQKLVNLDKVKIILGGACSGETLAIAPITEQAKVILFSAFSSNPSISDIGDFIFRNTPSDKDVAEGMALVAVNEGHNRVAILTENTDFALGVRENIVNKLNELGAEIVADEFYSQGTKDFRTQLTKIKNAQPEAIIFNPQAGTPGGLAVNQAKELGIDVPYYGGFSFSSGDALQAGGSALNGMKFVDAPGLGSSNAKATAYMEKFLAKYPKPASEWGTGARYDSVYLIAEAITACGDVDTECIRDYFYGLDKFYGVIGNYSFDANGDPTGLRSYAVKQIINAEQEDIIELE